jgi:YD repeat-containing protein
MTQDVVSGFEVHSQTLQVRGESSSEGVTSEPLWKAVYGFAEACPERSRRDNMGRLICTTTSYSFLPNQTFTNTYTYDAASNRTSLTAPDGSITTYGYDTLNRLNGRRILGLGRSAVLLAPG